MSTRLYRVEELSEASGVSIRNIRYYTAEGLLPPPDARGRFALYGPEHLRRLRLIQQLKEAYFPLPVIKARLQELPGPEVADAEEPDSAASYIQRVRARQTAASPPVPPMAAMPAAAPMAAPPEPTGETWQRITLAPGVELHVRQVNDFVRQLIAYARTLGRSDS